MSGPSCRAVAERLGVPEFLAAAAPDGVGQSAATLVATERDPTHLQACHLDQETKDREGTRLVETTIAEAR